MSTSEKQTSNPRNINTGGGAYVGGNVFARGDVIGRDQIIQYVTQVIGDEKDSTFTGLLKRIILAQNLTVGIIFSYMRGDPFPYARSLKLIALSISANRTEVKDWFKEWFSELDELLNNPKSDSDLSKIASELWLATELIEISYTKNKSSAEAVTTLIADFQRVRSEIIESLSNYSQELARKHSNLVHLLRL